MSRAVAVLLALAAAALAGACQGRKQGDRVEPDRPADAAASADAAGTAGSGVAGFGPGSDPGSAGAAAGSGSARAGQPDDPEVPADPSKQIAELGAIPAWQAVVDRARLLARRGEQGIVYGRIGPAVLAPAPPPDPADGGIPADAGAAPSPYVWLVDDSEGNGALGVRLALGKLQAKEGDRIAASGAWELDAERRWYWKAEALQPLSPPPAPPAPADPPYAVPSHVPATGGFPPNVRPIKQAKDNDAVYFQLAGPLPAREGDGWLIATQLYDLPIALLILPGERPSYGGHDMRSPDERWQLKRQQTYWVRIGKLRPQGAGKPVLVQARTPPIRVM